MGWYLKVLKKYAVFEGRARRLEYWMFTLGHVVIWVALLMVDPFGGLLFSIYYLAVFLPALGVTIRRLHDIDRCAWWVLITLVPLIGFIGMLVFMATDGDPFENRYGPDPKVLMSEDAN